VDVFFAGGGYRVTAKGYNRLFHLKL